MTSPEINIAPPTLAVYDVARSPPLWGIDRDFPFTEDKTKKYYLYLSGTFRETCRYTYSMTQQPLKSYDRPLMRVSLSDSILVTLIFY